LITDALAAFLSDYKFLFGVSLDGPAQIHDHYRKTLDGKPSHALVLKGIDRLRKHEVDFNVLTLVNDRTVKQAREIYGYFKNRGYRRRLSILSVSGVLSWRLPEVPAGHGRGKDEEHSV
jgi:uncharacterized protein